ncbi:MAG: hypothetical protein IPL39_16715 [Opitutaceae bacterium]|nr:hypothetical protein [Opitutaceae bacterium]
MRTNSAIRSRLLLPSLIAATKRPNTWGAGGSLAACVATDCMENGMIAGDAAMEEQVPIARSGRS